MIKPIEKTCGHLYFYASEEEDGRFGIYCTICEKLFAYEEEEEEENG